MTALRLLFNIDKRFKAKVSPLRLLASLVTSVGVSISFFRRNASSNTSGRTVFEDQIIVKIIEIRLRSAHDGEIDAGTHRAVNAVH